MKLKFSRSYSHLKTLKREQQHSSKKESLFLRVNKKRKLRVKEKLILKNPVRIVTAASLFDGHDASINIIRRMLQDAGAEVIHLGHNRSVHDVVTAAIQEGAQGVCISSYQGGHMEYFKYTRDLLDKNGASHVK